MDQLPVNPSWRSLAGIFLILLLIVAWSAVVVAAYGRIADAHWALQAVFFIVAGTVWVLPLKPLIRWMGK
jgi:predicted membrane channel-forming protein YqfA (hemolysin III family)